MVQLSTRKVLKEKHPEPRTPRGQRTREKLLAAAEHVFGTNGFHVANITDITRRARVSAGTFYTYFNSKEDLFRELVITVGREMRQASRNATEGLTDRLEQERAGFTAFFRYLEKHRYLYRILRQAEFVDEDLYREHYQRYSQGYIAGLNRAMAQGQIQALDTEVTAWCLMGIGEYLGMRWTLWDKGVPDHVINTMMQFISDGLRIRRQPEGGEGATDELPAAMPL